MTAQELLVELLKGKSLAEPLEQIPEEALFGVWCPPQHLYGPHLQRLVQDAKFEFNNFWYEFTRNRSYGKPRLLGEQPHINPQTAAMEFRFARLRK